ncbi:unnamed protein product [Calypogeia fissa]
MSQIFETCYMEIYGNLEILVMINWPHDSRENVNLGMVDIEDFLDAEGDLIDGIEDELQDVGFMDEDPIGS